MFELTKEEYVTQATYKQIAEQWDEKYSCARHKDMNWYAFSARLPHGAKILDLGCGTTYPEAEIVLSDGFEYFGIDLSEKMLEVARRNLSKQMKNTEGRLHQMDMRALKFEDESFDGIISATSFMHLPRNTLSLALREANRVLKRGGRGLISISHGTFEGLYAPRHGLPRAYCVCWQPDEFVDQITSAGFRLCLESEIDDMIITVVDKPE